MIRPFGLSDVMAVRRLAPRGTAFDLRQQVLQPASPARAALLGLLTHQHVGAVTCVQASPADGGVIAFIQAAPRANVPEWDLAHLGPSLDDRRDATELWHDLLAHLVVTGALRGVERIYARAPEDVEIETILRQCGFTVLTREEVFVLTRQPAPGPLPRGMHRVERQDRAAVEELCRQVVPPLLCQAEGLAPGGAAEGAGRGEAAEEYLWADRERALAYLSLARGRAGSWLEILVRPVWRADLLPAIRYLLTRTPCSDEHPIFSPVPDFAVGLGWLLRTLGFESYSRQTLLVAHTVARVPVRRRVFVAGLERGVDVGTPLNRMVDR